MAPKSCQIAHIYCLFFLMMVVCIANRDTDNTVKASKFNKDVCINMVKNEEYKIGRASCRERVSSPV